MIDKGIWGHGLLTESSRYEDIWVAGDVWWVADFNNRLFSSSDGGKTWSDPQDFTDNDAEGEAARCRCLGFSPTGEVGWAGGWQGKASVLKRWTKQTSWQLVQPLPAAAKKICGLWAVDDNVMFAAGTNDPADQSPGVLRTDDQGATWSFTPLSKMADVLIDIYFSDLQHGWVVGGRRRKSGDPFNRSHLCPVLLVTTDGGVRWSDAIDGQALSSVSEWGWKISVVQGRPAFLSLESKTGGGVLRCTKEGGWERLEVDGASHLQGIGFIDSQRGWVSSDYGNDRTWETSDGGATWQEVAQHMRINRFRLYSEFGVACGASVYRFDRDAPATVAPRAPGKARLLQLPAGAAGLRGHRPVDIDIVVPARTQRLVVEIVDPNGGTIVRIANERFPPPGHQRLRWDGLPDRGLPSYLCRVIADGRSETVPLAFVDG
ncbi:MAG: hypothetical protein ABIY55_25270 [Kofleriaceae bacterium]